MRLVAKFIHVQQRHAQACHYVNLVDQSILEK